MHRALIVKELRESAGITALAMLAMAFVLAGFTGFPILPWQSSKITHYPFVIDGFSFFLWFVAGGFAILLAMKQTAWELGKGTFCFLLHRPVNRRTIFLTKLLVGFGLVMDLTGLLILLYAWWAMTPGHFPAPFFWSMTLPAWQTWVALPVVYSGAFLSGLRPGRWFGSRLMPLVTAMVVALIAANVPWFCLSVVISLAATALGVIAILHYVHERDY
ncbi:MAG: hypothetical protein ACC645_15600 [Pirellulales bacterium]